MRMKDKIEKIEQAQSDMEYLRGEFKDMKLYANRDGEVEFEMFMEWLAEWEYNVEHMIKVAKIIKEI
jgi:hypothetical protein